jgi:opacity protein-like surface antigen
MTKTKLILATLALGTTYAFSGGDIAPIPMEPEPVYEETSTMSVYIGVGPTYAQVERDTCANGCGNKGTDKDGRVGGILRAGWNVSDYLGIEARALTTFESDVYSKTTHIGLYLKPQVAVAEQLTIYGLLGYGNTEVEYENSTEDVSGFSYGAGLEFDLNPEEQAGLGIWMDFQSLLTDEGTTNTSAHAFSGGLLYNF